MEPEERTPTPDKDKPPHPSDTKHTDDHHKHEHHHHSNDTKHTDDHLKHHHEHHKHHHHSPDKKRTVSRTHSHNDDHTGWIEATLKEKGDSIDLTEIGLKITHEGGDHKGVRRATVGNKDDIRTKDLDYVFLGVTFIDPNLNLTIHNAHIHTTNTTTIGDGDGGDKCTTATTATGGGDDKHLTTNKYQFFSGDKSPVELVLDTANWLSPINRTYTVRVLKMGKDGKDVRFMVKKGVPTKPTVDVVVRQVTGEGDE